MKRHVRVSMVVALVLAGHVLAASAAEVLVRVVDADGKPAAGVAVVVDAEAASQAKHVKGVHEVRQRRLRFEPALTVVAVGDEVVFTNDDDFDHHVTASADSAKFEFLVPAASAKPAKPKAGKRTEARTRLEKAGVVALSCHLHSSMRGHILVTDRPFFGTTDSNGEVKLSGLRGGQALVSTWHPLMLTRAPAVVSQVSADTTIVPVRLAIVLPAQKR